MRIALATCSNLPDWEVDDRPLQAALRAHGVEVDLPAWDDPRFPWGDLDACLIRTTWDYMERRDEFVAWAERVERETTLLHPSAVVRWNTHKGYLRDLEEGGVPVVPTIWLEPGVAVGLEEVIASRSWDRAFFKPAIGATARETLRFTAEPEALRGASRHLSRLHAAGETVLLQPYLASVEREGELSAIHLGGAFSHGVRKIPVAGDYRVQDDFGAHDEPAELPESVIGATERALAIAADRTGTDLLYGRADFLRDDSGDWRLTELELVEPSLFFRHRPEAAEVMAEVVVERVGRQVLRS